jgi:hypothetical protein
MYPAEELILLAAHKASLKRGIARHRATCIDAASRIARPFEQLDKVAGFWREIRPFIGLGAAPLGLLIARLALPRRGVLGALVRWGPLAFAVARLMGSVANDGGGSRRSGSVRGRQSASAAR